MSVEWLALRRLSLANVYADATACQHAATDLRAVTASVVRS